MAFALAIKNFAIFVAVLAVAMLVNVNLVAAMPSTDLSVASPARLRLAPRNITQQAGCPPGQSPNQAGCSSCAECCIFEFNDAGCGQHSVEEYVLNDYNCHSLLIDMNNVWITECTGSFVECMLWKNHDCSGEDSWGIDNTKDVCHHTQYWIGAIQCYESDEEKQLAIARARRLNK
ncbi:uncharacterized protein Z519_07599 [Cladophialophora bantiana CBS 173.52]|uniref:Uncharacterized protein n=1 Tax=Cladophialophora bantiana (strain ATCC 10958 / CBS 173.52 / CDC B-1940 / NIH 8579) TaxID=1442370 RepID=A0A0D2ENS1_CLAB1|nr:uncharacterized protein Z519_07599 [Cladophialophora bantiana CBS 173.52]KIW91631.1 hypothetical protein Z519_07599 [Cladophialophora bantiana CBS 173.52]